MAKKKAATVKKKSLSAMTGPIGGPVPSAMTGPIGPNVPSARMGQIGPDLIGANIGRAQQIEGMEQAQMIDTLRSKAKDRLAKKKLIGEVSLGPTTTQAFTERPMAGGLNEPVDAKTKKKVSVKKKKS